MTQNEIEKENIKSKKDIENLQNENNKLNTVIDGFKIKLLASENNTADILKKNRVEQSGLEFEMKRAQDRVLLTESISNEKIDTLIIEKNKLKNEFKLLLNQHVASDLLKNDEVLILNKENLKLQTTIDEMNAKLNFSELQISQNSGIHEAEKERVSVLQNSKAQIAAAEARIIFSTEKRKLKEELSNINKKNLILEKEAENLKKISIELEIKIKELSSMSNIDDFKQEEKITQLLKSRDLYDHTLHGNGQVAKSGKWVDICRSELDSSDSKISVLKQCLSKFRESLDEEGKLLLLTVGVSF